jgi:transposase-like protein
MAKQASSDRRRTQWSRADAQRVLDEWQRSGDTLEAFARARGLVPQRIAWWRKRLAPAPRSMKATALTLVPATVLSAEPVAVLRLPGGSVLELSSVSPSWIAALAHALARSQS